MPPELSVPVKLELVAGDLTYKLASLGPGFARPRYELDDADIQILTQAEVTLVVTVGNKSSESIVQIESVEPTLIRFQKES